MSSHSAAPSLSNTAAKQLSTHIVAPPVRIQAWLPLTRTDPVTLHPEPSALPCPARRRSLSLSLSLPAALGQAGPRGLTRGGDAGGVFGGDPLIICKACATTCCRNTSTTAWRTSLVVSPTTSGARGWNSPFCRWWCIAVQSQRCSCSFSCLAQPAAAPVSSVPDTLTCPSRDSSPRISPQASWPNLEVRGKRVGEVCSPVATRNLSAEVLGSELQRGSKDPRSISFPFCSEYVCSH